MKEKLVLAKEHIRKHKELYIGIGIGVGLAGISWAIMRGNTAQGGVDVNAAQGGTIDIASLIYRNKGTINAITVMEREGRGHPGWPCRNVETGKNFLSQRDAANYYGVPEGILSAHINGKFPDVDGLHFERVNLSEVK